MLTHFAAALGVLGLLTVVPGPDMAVVTRRALVAGPGDALRTVGGITTGLLLWGALSVAGLAAVLAASPAAYLAVKLLGAAYLVFPGAQALWQNRRSASHTTRTDSGSPASGARGGPAWSATRSIRRSPSSTPGCFPPWPRRSCPPPGP